MCNAAFALPGAAPFLKVLEPACLSLKDEDARREALHTADAAARPLQLALGRKAHRQPMFLARCSACLTMRQ